MSFNVQVARSVEDALAELKLPSDLIAAVYLHLTSELPRKGKQALFRVKAPIDAWIYSFSLREEGPTVRQHLFTFEAKFTQDEESLVLIYSGHIVRDITG